MVLGRWITSKRLNWVDQINVCSVLSYFFKYLILFFLLFCSLFLFFFWPEQDSFYFPQNSNLICPRDPKSIAFVMPFIPPQLDRVLYNLQTWNESFKIPCYCNNRNDSSSNLIRDVHFIFAYSEPFSSSVQQSILEIWNRTLIPLNATNCFKSISFLWAPPKQ